MVNELLSYWKRNFDPRGESELRWLGKVVVKEDHTKPEGQPHYLVAVYYKDNFFRHFLLDCQKVIAELGFSAVNKLTFEWENWGRLRTYLSFDKQVYYLYVRNVSLLVDGVESKSYVVLIDPNAESPQDVIGLDRNYFCGTRMLRKDMPCKVVNFNQLLNADL